MTAPDSDRKFFAAARRGSRPARARVEKSELLAVRGLAARSVAVHLPPGYEGTRPEPYPLLLALDGQAMPQWNLAGTLDDLIGRGVIEPVVVATVPASAERIDEYGTAGTRDFAGRGGPRARAFQELLAGVVLPWLRGRYRLALTPDRTGIFGASMGGLCAFDTAWRRPQIFGVAGIFSGSLWWRTDNSNPAAQQASRIVHEMVRTAASRRALRLWFEAGTRDESADRDGNGVIDAIQDTRELIEELVRKGFQRGAEVEYCEIEGGEHHESTWAAALPGFLAWAFPRETLLRDV